MISRLPVFVAGGLLCVIVWAVLHHRRARREAEYRQIAATLRAELPPHTSRADADRYLNEKNFSFTQEWGPGSVALDDFVRFGSHERSPWFCGYRQPGVLVRFASSQSRVASGTIPAAGPHDEVTQIVFDEWPMDCL